MFFYTFKQIQILLRRATVLCEGGSFCAFSLKKVERMADSAKALPAFVVTSNESTEFS